MIPPHAGQLVNRYVLGTEREQLLEEARVLPQIVLDQRGLSDLEMIACGALSPLTGFMSQADYHRVLQEMQLESGIVWSLPVTLSVDENMANSIKKAQRAVLMDPHKHLLAILQVNDIYRYDKEVEAQKVYGTLDGQHPGVAYLYQQSDYLIGGLVQMLQKPSHPHFHEYRLEPVETRKIFQDRRWKTIVAFQTRNPIHRAHEYLHKCALEMVDGLLIHPLVGETKPDDIPAEIRLKSYQVLIDEYYPKQRVLLSVFPAAMRYAGPREAIFHAIVRKNYGCTHIIIGRDHAGVGNYYGPLDAQRIFRQFDEKELEIKPLFFDNAFFCRACGSIATAKSCPHDHHHHLVFSGTRLREMLQYGESPPPEILRPEVAQLLLEHTETGQILDDLIPIRQLEGDRESGSTENGTR